ncbi:MAG: ABC transporter substrate-binding protein [Pirellula sp.]|nr:ABC transporter substrate-binding protein [Pirellula sp.]
MKRSLFVVALLCLFWVGNASDSSVYSQDIEAVLKALEIEGTVIDGEPFDVITVTKEAGGKSVQVRQLELPGRKMPREANRTGKLQCVVTIFPDRLYEIEWKDITQITFWEDIVLHLARKYLKERNYAEAFEHLVYLRENYPKSVNFASLHQEFLFQSARDMATEKNLPHTLAALEELRRKFPEYRKDDVSRVISTVSEQMINGLFERGEYAVARSMVLRLNEEYGDELPVIGAAKNKFVEIASAEEKKVAEFREKGDYGRARQAAMKMLDIEPEYPGGKELLNDLIREFPLVRVGVFQQTDSPNPAALADWPASRTGQLIQTPLFQFRRTGPEGGMYRFAYGNDGSAALSDDRLELNLTIQNSEAEDVPNSLQLSQALLQRASIQSELYTPGWASIFQSVSVQGPDRLKLRFRRPHVLPQAFLQWQLQDMDKQSFNKSLYRFDSDDGEVRRYKWAGSEPPLDFQPREIQEVLFSNADSAVAALTRGELEFIDRLFPADVRKVGNVKTVKTEPYALPIVHMLIPRSTLPIMEDREFRRALLYGINREAILKDEILGGLATSLDRVISGPFPAGESDSDPLAYAYNTNVPDAKYDPRLAKILVLLAQAKQTLKANKSQDASKAKEAAPPLPVIRLGVPNYESARVAGQAILQAWKVIGLDGKLVPYDKLPSRDDKSIDVLYISASLWEPVSDAERLFGIGGAAQSDNQYIVQALGMLNSARSWKEVRQGCLDLHSLVAAHLPVIPLWQVTETMAYRTELTGVAKKPLSLYQDVQRWRIQAR